MHTSEVVGAIEQQEMATGEISHNVAGAAAGSKAVVAALGEVAGGITQTRSSAQTVLAASEEVENATVTLRAEVEAFPRRKSRAARRPLNAPPRNPACRAGWRRRGACGRRAKPR